MTVLSRIISSAGIDPVNFLSFTYTGGLKTAWSSYSDKTVTGIIGNGQSVNADPNLSPSYVAFGNGGKIATSNNFTTWTNKTTLNSAGWGTANILACTEYQPIIPVGGSGNKVLVVGGQGGLVAFSIGTVTSEGPQLANTWVVGNLSNSTSWDAGSSYNNDITTIYFDQVAGTPIFIVGGRRGQIAYISLGNILSGNIAHTFWSFTTTLKNISELAGSSVTAITRFSSRTGSIFSGTTTNKYIVGFDNGKAAISGDTLLNPSTLWSVSTITDGSSIDGILSHQYDSSTVYSGLSFLINNSTSVLHTTAQTRPSITPITAIIPTNLEAGKGMMVFNPNNKLIVSAKNSSRYCAFQSSKTPLLGGTTERIWIEPGIDYTSWPKTSTINCLGSYTINFELGGDAGYGSYRTLLVGGTDGEVVKINL